jgi:hypothetical protein
MGSGAGVQEFGVPASLAASALNGFAAARAWLAAISTDRILKYSETGRYAIMGYSEGGIAALAAVIAATSGSIPVAGLRLTAAYPMAGVFNLSSGVQMGPVYEIFFVVGWARAYPDKIRMQEILLPGIIENVVPLFDGTHTDAQVTRMISLTVGKMPGNIQDSDIFTQEYLQELRDDPESVPYFHLQNANALDRWMPPPGIPVVLAATPSDAVISFSRIEEYYQRVRSQDPTADIIFVRLAAGTHALGAVEGFLCAIQDLDRREALFRQGQQPVR